MQRSSAVAASVRGARTLRAVMPDVWRCITSSCASGLCCCVVGVGVGVGGSVYPQLLWSRMQHTPELAKRRVLCTIMIPSIAFITYISITIVITSAAANCCAVQQ